MRPYRLRYHLAKGPNFMKWQVRNKKLNLVDYCDPDSFVYTCMNGKLNNSSRTAQKIHDGDNKTVCSWISYSHFLGVNETLYSHSACRSMGGLTRISYNPRIQPNWIKYDSPDTNIDGFEGDVFIINKSLYVSTVELNNYIGIAEEKFESNSLYVS